MFYKIGHRGASGYEKENTLASFYKALALGANMIELDIRICQSGEPVIIHDKYINRLSQESGLVRKKPLDELKKLGFFSLVEILEKLPNDTKFNIELKEKETVLPVVKILKYFIKIKKFETDNFLISSFDYSILKVFYSKMSYLKLGLLISRNPFSCFMNFFLPLSIFYIKRAQKINAYSIHIYEKIAKQKIIQKFQKNNFKVFIYTVNDYLKIQELKQKGADGIFSDYPDRL